MNSEINDQRDPAGKTLTLNPDILPSQKSRKNFEEGFMTDFFYSPMFPTGKDETKYIKIDTEPLEIGDFQGNRIVKVPAGALTDLARKAMMDVSFFFRTSHLEGFSRILQDPDASDNDRFVALTMLKNAVIASDGILPSCQDTGTAIILGKKGQQIWTGYDDEEALSRGVFRTYTEENLRYSQNAPLTMYDEINTRCNLPAQIDILADRGDAYKFLFLAKGGGSANKTFLYQETRAILNPVTLRKFLEEKLRSLGTAACPPYHLSIVIGGTSAETNLKTVKLASAKYYDNLPTRGDNTGHAFRDLEMEAVVLDIANKIGLGAQFGGKYFAHDARVIRLPRHGASLPVGLGVSCSADRNILGKITADGVFVEELDRNPARFLPGPETNQAAGNEVRIDLNRPMNEIRAELSRHPVKTRLLLNGKLIVARDIAHAKLKERVDAGGELPDYFKNHIVYYAGPAKTPEGYPSGSFGPTTAGRMDSYVEYFQSRGGSMIMLAKGNRSQAVTDSCKKFGGFYLGSIGGPAAILAKENIKAVRVVEFEELGMEAIWEITVEDFPAFIIVDDKGNDFFQQLG